MLRLLFIATFIFFSNFSFASELLENQIRECSSIKDESKRLKCFDLLSQSLPVTKAAEIKPIEEVTKTTEVKKVPIVKNQESIEQPKSEKIPTDLGGSAFTKNGKPKGYEGNVVSCKASQDKKWFYFFENGQVWKQVDNRKIRHKKCKFPATIRKDGFGYMMFFGNNQKVRISRKK